jgi:phospholipase C
MSVPTDLHMRPNDVAGAVDTIVLVMLENRSFDHLLGWMSLPPYGNRTDIDGLKGPIDSSTRELKNPMYRNRARNQVWRPYMAEKDVWLASDLPHGRNGVRMQMHYVLPGYLADVKTGEKYDREGFAMDGFADAHFEEHPKLAWGSRPESLMIMPPELIPATAFLAREFMVCDHWFSPIPTDTHPNRLMSLCGYTKIDQTSGEPIPLPDHESVLDWCDGQKLRWRVYGESLSFVTLFTAMRPHGLEADPKHFRNVSELAHDFQRESDGTFPNFVVVEPAYADDPVVNKLHLHRATDNHPPNPMGPGESFLADVYRAVTSNPERWKRTVMIVVYDEHGGFFDHVPPFRVTTSSPGFEDDAWQDKADFLTSGPRVPAIVVSPLVGRGSASSRRFDHTSILQFLADVATPGHAYSKLVNDRHREGGIYSLSTALSAEPLQGKAPIMPPIRLPKSANALPSSPQPVTAGVMAFDKVRQILAAQRKEAVAAISKNAAPKIKLGSRNYIAARHVAVSKA